jgi:hypothetical protein
LISTSRRVSDAPAGFFCIPTNPQRQRGSRSFAAALPAGGVGLVTAESGVPESTITKLEALGHRLRRGPSGGGYQGILIDREHGTLHGTTESRKDGAAVAIDQSECSPRVAR